MPTRKKLKITLPQHFVVAHPAQTITAPADGEFDFDHENDGHDDLPIEGEIVGEHYRLVRRLGSGMFGRVYMAERTDVLEHRVALKVITRIVYAGRDVERELVMLAASTHPNIVQLKDHGVTDDYVWLTMPLYDGETLAQRLERGPLGLKEAYDIFLPITRGVQALHERGLRHQDIKPENIFLARLGEHIHPVLLDLGVAVERCAAFVAGTVLYAAPEQVAALAGVQGSQPIDEKIDTYCLATTLLRSLVEAKHFADDVAPSPYDLTSLFDQRQTSPLAEGARPELTGSPRQLLNDALARWMAYHPEDRSSAHEMADELGVLLEQEHEAERAINEGIQRQRASLQRFRIALGAMLLIGGSAALYGFSKRETLRLAGELQRVRAEGAASFDQLDTCSASYALAKGQAETCTSQRQTDHKTHQQTVARITAAGAETSDVLNRRVANSVTRFKTCQEDAEAEAKNWASDKEQLSNTWQGRQRHWDKQREQLTTNLSQQKQSRRSCEAKLSHLATGRTECREDLASCIEDRDTCMRTPAPTAAPVASGTPTPVNSASKAPLASVPPTPELPPSAPPAAAGTSAAPNE